MNTTELKIIALVAMVIDHLGGYFPNIPGSMYFRWIGRLAIPIFIYCLIIGFINTSNKKHYFIRLYILNIVMSLLLFFIPKINGNIIATFIYIFTILFLIDKYKTNKSDYKKYVIYFILFKVIGYTLAIASFSISSDIHLLVCRLFYLLPLIEGGIILILLGVFIYMYIDNKKMLTISFIVYATIILITNGTNLLLLISNKLINHGTLLTIYNFLIKIIFGLNLYSLYNHDILFTYCNWMFVFALPIIYKYNGQRGKNIKYLFYIFYPLHLIILVMISELFV